MTATESASPRREVSEQAQEAVTTIQEKAQGTALDLQDQASVRVQSEIDSRTTQMSETLTPIADALRKGAEQLETEGKGSSAQLAGRAAEQTDRLASYLRRANGNSLVGDIEDAARSRPWLVTGVGVAVGFVSSRFIKASSARRSESRFLPAVGTGAPSATQLDPARGT